MKLLHLSDLHLGKRLNEFSLVDDQDYILGEILRITDEEKPDGVLIAGDVYDKSVPSAEAVQLFDDFLVRFAARGVPVFVIAGNHDSPERLAFGNRLMDKTGVHIASAYGGKVTPLSLSDEYGEVRIYLLPFVKPANVRRFFPDENIENYTDALRVAIKEMQVDERVRNLLVTHQFVTGARRSDSEEVTVGGEGNVDASVFAPFDYVALGHIHSPQNIGSERIRYCGTPLKYSFSEADDQKAVTVVTLGKKGSLSLREVPLVPKRDLAEIRGSYEELTRKSYYENTSLAEDYTRIILTDEEDIPEAMGKLRVIYHNLMLLSYDNRRTRHLSRETEAEDVENKSPLDLFSELYEKQNGAPMSEEQRAFISGLIEKIREDEACDR